MAPVPQHEPKAGDDLLNVAAHATADAVAANDRLTASRAWYEALRRDMGKPDAH